MTECRHGLSEDCPGCMQETIDALRGELERARGLLTLTLHTESGRHAQYALPPSDLVALCDRLDNHAGWARRDRNLNLEEDLIEAATKLRARTYALTSTECGDGK